MIFFSFLFSFLLDSFNAVVLVGSCKSVGPLLVIVFICVLYSSRNVRCAAVGLSGPAGERSRSFEGHSANSPGLEPQRHSFVLHEPREPQPNGQQPKPLQNRRPVEFSGIYTHWEKLAGLRKALHIYIYTQNVFFFLF